MTTHAETGHVTGTADKDYNLVWFLESCLQNSLRLEQYIADAKQGGDEALVDLFTRAQEHSRRGADEAKQLLSGRLT